MNEMNPLTPEDCLLIELLVDGELEEGERKELLKRMDRIDGGWRHCAITFLQGQLFSQSFCDISSLSPPAYHISSTTNTSVAHRPTSRYSKNNLFMVLVSGFLLTAILGSVVLAMKYRDSINSPTIVALAPEKNVIADQFSDETIASTDPIRMVTLKSPNKELDGISVPCVETTHYSPETYNLQRNDRNTTFVNDLRNQGHRVETVHEDLMFPLKDGRSLILPVDTFNVQYVNRKQYQ